MSVRRSLLVRSTRGDDYGGSTSNATFYLSPHVHLLTVSTLSVDVRRIASILCLLRPSWKPWAWKAMGIGGIYLKLIVVFNFTTENKLELIWETSQRAKVYHCLSSKLLPTSEASFEKVRVVIFSKPRTNIRSN